MRSSADMGERERRWFYESEWIETENGENRASRVGESRGDGNISQRFGKDGRKTSITIGEDGRSDWCMT